MKNKKIEQAKEYNFGEKLKEKYKTKDGWRDLEVWQTPKYSISRNKAVELIESGVYGLDEGDFWILKNQGGEKLLYTGLIISHNGCLKINDKLDDGLKFDPECVSFLKDAGGEKVMQYISKSQKIYEFGEISSSNCRNEYPYAMVLKRLMDRVILKNSKIGFFGIYSEAESDDFKESNSEDSNSKDEPTKKLLNGLAKAVDDDMKKTRDDMNKSDFDEILAKIKKCKSREELLKVRTESKSVVASLNKYQKPLFEKYLEAKNEKLFALMKADIEGMGSLSELEAYISDSEKDLIDLQGQALDLYDMLQEAVDLVKIDFVGN